MPTPRRSQSPVWLQECLLCGGRLRLICMAFYNNYYHNVLQRDEFSRSIYVSQCQLYEESKVFVIWKWTWNDECESEESDGGGDSGCLIKSTTSITSDTDSSENEDNGASAVTAIKKFSPMQPKRQSKVRVYLSDWRRSLTTQWTRMQ